MRKLPYRTTSGHFEFNPIPCPTVRTARYGRNIDSRLTFSRYRTQAAINARQRLALAIASSAIVLAFAAIVLALIS